MSGIDFRGFLERNIPHSSAPVPSWGWLMVQMLGYVLEGMEKVMAAQDDINAAVSAIGGVLTDVQNQVGTLANDLDAWIKANPQVDTSALAPLVANAQSVQAALDSQVTAITDAVNPAPAPAPAPEPTPAPAPEPTPEPAPAPAPEPPAGS